jgi:hypothetical protein
MFGRYLPNREAVKLFQFMLALLLVT